MNIKQFSSDGEIAHLIKPILKVLQEAGGQLECSEIKAWIADMDDQIAEFAEIWKEVQENSTSNLINWGALLFLKGWKQRRKG